MEFLNVLADDNGSAFTHGTHKDGNRENSPLSSFSLVRWDLLESLKLIERLT